MQVIVMTSDKYHHCLNPFFYLFDKYFLSSLPSSVVEELDLVVCGFSPPTGIDLNHYGWRFQSIGRWADYPPARWSDAFIKVLDKVAEPTFLLMLEDYWIVRPVDTRAVKMLYDYCRQFQNVLKIDLAYDRLYADPGRYHYGFNTYNNVGYIDLIKSPPGSNYQMSLWGGLWNRDVMRRFIVPGERAQEIELFGTGRVNEAGDTVLVLGTRQAPLVHGNIYQSGRQGPVYADQGWRVNEDDLFVMHERGWL